MSQNQPLQSLNTPEERLSDQQQSIGNVDMSGSGNQLNVQQARGNIINNNNYSYKDETDPGVKKYIEEAKEPISSSYERCRKIDEKCESRLEKLLTELRTKYNATSLSKELAHAIDSIILQDCDESLKQLEKYIGESEKIIRSFFESNNKDAISEVGNDVICNLRELRIEYKLEEVAVAQPLIAMGSIFKQEGKYKWAQICLDEALSFLEGVKAEIDPNIYVNLATIQIKQSKYTTARAKLEKAVEQMREDKGSFREEDIQDIQELIEAIKVKERNSLFGKFQLFNKS